MEDVIDFTALATGNSFRESHNRDYKSKPVGYNSTQQTDDERNTSQEGATKVRCPRCKFGILVRRVRKADNTPFYGCSEYFTTGCKGSMDEASYLEAMADEILDSDKRK